MGEKESLFNEMNNNGMYMKDAYEVIDSECIDIVGASELASEKILMNTIAGLDLENRRLVVYYLRFNALISSIYELLDMAGITNRELNGVINDFFSRKPNGKVDSFDEINELKRFNLIIDKIACKELKEGSFNYLSLEEVYNKLYTTFDNMVERCFIRSVFGIKDNKGINKSNITLDMRKGNI